LDIFDHALALVLMPLQSREHFLNLSRSPLPAAPPRSRAKSATRQRLIDVRDLPLVEVPTRLAGGTINEESADPALRRRRLGKHRQGYLWPRWPQAAYRSSVEHSQVFLEKTPTGSRIAADLERIIRSYSAAWKRPKVLLIGFSFGADALPFLYTRLPIDVRNQVVQ